MEHLKKQLALLYAELDKTTSPSIKKEIAKEIVVVENEIKLKEWTKT